MFIEWIVVASALMVLGGLVHLALDALHAMITRWDAWADTHDVIERARKRSQAA